MSAPQPNEETKIGFGTMLVGKYRVVREIGRGGMAAVYEAEQLSLGKKVAIKVLNAELAASTIVIERFFREARAAASIKSPYIVDVYDSGRLEDGRPFIAMELLEGESLYDRMARIRLIDPATTVRVITQCAKGLQKAHDANIVHRDLKPENIFIVMSEDGEEVSKILDFGLAKFYAPVKPDEQSKRLTREGAVFGTPAYMSPEQVKGQGNVDHRSDLWALGCMTYECLTGRPVWNMDQGVAMTFAAIATGSIPVPSQMRADLPEAFDLWFQKSLEREPDRRFQSARELADALHDVWGDLISVGSLRSTARGRHAPAGASSGKLPSRHPDEHVSLPSAELETERPPPPPGSGGLPAAQGALPGAHVHPSSGAIPAFASTPGFPPPISYSSQSMLAAGATAQSSSSLGVDGQAASAPKKASPVRLVISAVLCLAGVGGAGFVYASYLRPVLSVGEVESRATASSGDATNTPPPKVGGDEPRWGGLVADGQKLFASGDVAGAKKRLDEASALGAGPVAKSLAELMQAPVSGPCKVAAFSHPRLSITAAAGRPTVAAAPKGGWVAWTDSHEIKEHAYSVFFDTIGRPSGVVRDLTPEAGHVYRPVLLPTLDRYALFYSDAKGSSAGIRARFLDSEGHVVTDPVLVGAAREGQFWPSVERTAAGFFVVWQDNRDREGEDIFARQLGPNLDHVTPEMRLTDYALQPKMGVNARLPSVAVAANSIFVVYRLERGPVKTIVRLRMPLSGLKGLEEREKDSKSKADRFAGDVQVLSDEKQVADAPAIACGSEGCFVAWHVESATGGGTIGMIEPKAGNRVWLKPMTGAHPSLTSNADGQVVAAFYDKGRLKFATLSRDGLGAATTFGKVEMDFAKSAHARPSVAPGAIKGEWYVAWEDREGTPAHSEPFVARLLCP